MTLGNARTLEIRLAVGDKDVAALRGALLAARASELAEVRRRTARHSFGYGDDSQRQSMSAEAAQAHRRWTMLDGLDRGTRRRGQRSRDRTLTDDGAM